MQTATKSLEQWLSECPDDYAFSCRFIDVKLDVESVAESEEVSLTDEQLDHVIDRFINLDWSVNNEIISDLIEDELRDEEWSKSLTLVTSFLITMMT